ncbi:hypothetical protein HYT23_06210 [Candidatus Pacearchaeota archaeon]|nr:hypothetical protein [Candidatus Pacearchaeota archaeon]
MNLKEYLENFGKIQTFYGVEEKFDNKLVKFQIKLKNKIEKENLAKEIQQLVFKKVPKNLYVCVSDKSWYTNQGKEYKISSIATISLDKGLVEKEFKNELKKSERVRKEKLRYLEEKIKPFLKNLMQSKLVWGCIVRGDLLDPNRFPHRFSDIDIVILTNFKSDDMKNKKILIDMLKSSLCTIILEYYNFYSGGKFYGERKLLVKKKSKHEIGFSVISMLDFENLHKIWKEKKRYIRKYDAQNFSNARILFEKRGTAKKFLKLFLSLAPGHNAF